MNYEYFIFSSHEGYINENLKKAEAEGWIVAGEAHVKYHGAPTSAAFIYIPMKRKIKCTISKNTIASLAFWSEPAKRDVTH